MNGDREAGSAEVVRYRDAAEATEPAHVAQRCDAAYQPGITGSESEPNAEPSFRGRRLEQHPVFR